MQCARFLVWGQFNRYENGLHRMQCDLFLYLELFKDKTDENLQVLLVFQKVRLLLPKKENAVVITTRRARKFSRLPRYILRDVTSEKAHMPAVWSARQRAHRKTTWKNLILKNIWARAFIFTTPLKNFLSDIYLLKDARLYLCELNRL